MADHVLRAEILVVAATFQAARLAMFDIRVPNGSQNRKIWRSERIVVRYVDLNLEVAALVDGARLGFDNCVDAAR